MNVPSVSSPANLPDRPAAPPVQWLTQFISLAHTISGFWASTNQPRIRECMNHQGKFWRVYDPITCKSTICFSEDEVRAWLERRYY